MKRTFASLAALLFSTLLSLAILTPGLALAQTAGTSGVGGGGHGGAGSTYVKSTDYSTALDNSAWSYQTALPGSSGNFDYGQKCPPGSVFDPVSNQCGASCPSGYALLYGQCIVFGSPTGGGTAPVISLSLNSTNLILGSPLTVSWTSSGAVSCDAVFGDGADLCGNGPNTCKLNNSITWVTSKAGAHSITLTCKASDGTPASQTVNYTVSSASSRQAQLDALLAELNQLEQEIAALMGTGTTTGNVTMTIPGSVTLASGQTAVTTSSIGATPIFTLLGVNASQNTATVSVVTGYSCPSASSPCTAAATTSATLALNVPQTIGGSELFTLLSDSGTFATIRVATTTSNTFTVPGSASFTSVGQRLSDGPQGYVLQLNTTNPSQSSAAVTLTLQTPCNPAPGGDCAIVVSSISPVTFVLNQPQTLFGVTMTLTAVTTSSASVSLSTALRTLTIVPVTGSAPLAVTANFNSGTSCSDAYDLSWGDGSSDFTMAYAGPSSPGGACTAIGVINTPTHTYTTAGTYTVKLKSGASLQSQQSATVTVN